MDLSRTRPGWSQFRGLARPRRGSKPARTNDRGNQSPRRAEFFALPVIPGYSSSSEDFFEVFLDPSLFEPSLLLLPPLLEELVFFLGLSDSSVSSVSLDALATLELPEVFDLLLPLLEEVVFFLGLSDSSVSVSSVSLDALASFELPLDLPSPLEPLSSYEPSMFCEPLELKACLLIF